MERPEHHGVGLPERVRERFGDSGRSLSLDSAAGSRVLEASLQRAAAFARRGRAQLGGPYHQSRLAARALERSWRRLAELVNLPDGGCLYAGTSVTGLLQSLASALAGRLSAGDEIVVTCVDHDANIEPWLGLADAGVRVRWWRPARPEAPLDPAELDPLLGPRTRLVCVTHCSNVTGAVSPLPEIVRRAHRADVAVCADGTAYAPHRAVDLAALQVDFYVLSLFKCFGPQLALLALAPRPCLDPGPAARALLARHGYDYAALYAASAVADHLATLAPGGASPATASRRGAIEVGYAAIARHETGLLGELDDVLHDSGLQSVGPGLTDSIDRVPIVACTGPGAAVLAPALAHRGIGVRYGDFRAPRLLRALGHVGLLRISLAHYHDAADLRRLGRALEADANAAGATDRR